MVSCVQLSTNCGLDNFITVKIVFTLLTAYSTVGSQLHILYHSFPVYKRVPCLSSQSLACICFGTKRVKIRYCGDLKRKQKTLLLTLVLLRALWFLPTYTPARQTYSLRKGDN